MAARGRLYWIATVRLLWDLLRRCALPWELGITSTTCAPAWSRTAAERPRSCCESLPTAFSFDIWCRELEGCRLPGRICGSWKFGSGDL
ncbi:hypothetical protein NDU88_003172 [Pleurodeles waltl]|uniref:Secreted protein n=1 Tax=Pleurodeles waltl TaxID=8319 RepID=A0AAV7KU50_PLEWA|nr:hypothetical protein NDU88_003172 [Pleurodeles waltl]